MSTCVAPGSTPPAHPLETGVRAAPGRGEDGHASYGLNGQFTPPGGQAARRRDLSNQQLGLPGCRGSTGGVLLTRERNGKN